MQSLTRTPTLALRQRKAHLLRSFEPSPHLLHASLVERFLKCGKANCHCHTGGPKHGPFFISTLLRQRADAITAAQVPRPNPAARQSVTAYAQVLEVLDQISQINHELLPPGRAAGRGLSMNELAQFLGYVTKVFGFGRVVRSVRCRRPYPTIPTRCLFLSLFLGVVVRAGSYLDISKQTKRRRWQHLIHLGSTDQRRRLLLY